MDRLQNAMDDRDGDRKERKGSIQASQKLNTERGRSNKSSLRQFVTSRQEVEVQMNQIKTSQNLKHKKSHKKLKHQHTEKNVQNKVGH